MSLDLSKMVNDCRGEAKLTSDVLLPLPRTPSLLGWAVTATAKMATERASADAPAGRFGMIIFVLFFSQDPMSKLRQLWRADVFVDLVGAKNCECGRCSMLMKRSTCVCVGDVEPIINSSFVHSASEPPERACVRPRESEIDFVCLSAVLYSIYLVHS